MVDEYPPDFPYTEVTVSESQLVRASVRDQVRYAVFNGVVRPDDIAARLPVGASLCADVVASMTDEGDLTEQADAHGTFVTLPTDVSTTGLSDSERAEIHAEARAAYEAAPDHGDSRDKLARLNDMTDDRKPSSTDRPGDDTVTGIEASDDDVTEALSTHGGMLPVDRDYDWDQHRLDPDTVAEYVEAESEYSDMMAEIEERRATGKLPRFRWTGPTGCGKTTAGENVAVDLDAPCFIVECHDGLRPNNLLGMPTYVGDETWWVDGPVTKALLSSRERPTVLIFDEPNRTTSRTLGVLMSVLDHRCSVTLNARGGETVQGDPQNLIVFSAMNEGDGYVVNKIDRAQKRRFGNTFQTDYIGQSSLAREAHLVEHRTPVGPATGPPSETDFSTYSPSNVATEVVRAANAIRDQADRQRSDVTMGVPTSTVLNWCRTAWSYRDDDPDGGPLLKAAERTFLNTFYTDDAYDTVKTAIESHVRGLEVGDEDTTTPGVGEADDSDDSFDTDVEVSDESYLLCDNCGFFETVGACDSDTVMKMECPDCSDALTPKEAR